MMSEPAIVELSIGRFEVREPHLLGWKESLACLPPEDYALVGRMIWKVKEAWDGLAAEALPEDTRRSALIAKITAEAFDLLAPITARVPEVVATFAAACLRGPLGKGETVAAEGPPFPAQQFLQHCGASDALKIFRAGAAAGVFGSLDVFLKNAEGLAPTTPAKPSDSAQA